MIQKCGNCKFIRSGECHAHPPVVTEAASHLFAQVMGWPRVEENDWCGEWEKTTARTLPPPTDVVDRV